MSKLPRVAFVSVSLAALFFVAPADAHAQDEASRVRVRKLESPQLNLTQPVAGSTRGTAMLSGARPAIMLTGYWPPTNEAVRRFSPNPAQNPLGWIGSNWEGRGYDVYSYFPEFTPPNCTSCGTGVGDLTVDYQDTLADFFALANAIQPVAIITFSRGSVGLNWEVEMNQYNRATWVNDYVAPFQPNPAPPDASLPANALRLSTLPVQEIVDDVITSNSGLNAFICFSGSGGGFLSEFIAYLGVWYQAMHSSPLDPAWCVAAGHIHVGTQVSWPDARRAAGVSLRTLIRHVDSIVLPAPTDFDLYCPTNDNSVSLGALLSPLGSSSVSLNTLGWTVHDAPPSANGFLYYGAAQTTGIYGNGAMCVASPRLRIPPILACDPSGSLTRSLDLSLPPFDVGVGAVLAGSTWNFQFAYRDPAGGGLGLNASNGVSVQFSP